MFTRKSVAIIFSLLISFAAAAQNEIQASNKISSDSISFKQLVGVVEQRYKVRIFYKQSWFSTVKFSALVADDPLQTIIADIENGRDYSALFYDKIIIFMPKEGVTELLKPENKIPIIGNQTDYGKYVRATISGQINDGSTGEPLLGASLYEEELNVGTTTDKNGRFSMNLPVGIHRLRVSYVGYENAYEEINLVSNGKFGIELFEKTVKLGEVLIYSHLSEYNVTQRHMSMVRLDIRSIKELPLNLGEADIMKSMTLLPGIQTVGEFGAGFNVRGGSADQNLILMEDVPLFNSAHVFGLTSAVNSDDIQSLTLWKAGIPARYGERISSVMDIKMKPGNPEYIKGNGGVGLIDDRLSLEIPLIKNKASLLVGGRNSYSDWILRQIKNPELNNSLASFYDLNALLNVNLNKANKLTGFVYHSTDWFAFDKSTFYRYDNTLGSIKWEHIFSDKLSMTFMTGFSHYNFSVAVRDTFAGYAAYKINSDLQYNNFKWNVTFVPGKIHNVNFGVNGISYRLLPGSLKPYGSESIVETSILNAEKAIETGVYASDEISFNSRFGAEIGLRFSYYALFSPLDVFVYDNNYPKSAEHIIDTIHFTNGKAVSVYSGLEPRLGLKYTLTESSSLKFSYNRINQYLNLVSNTSVISPTDVWKLSDRYVKPIRLDQIALGYYRNFNTNRIESSIEVYYKNISNIPDYRNGANLLMNKNLDADLLEAKGYNYGVELYVKKNFGDLTGWVSYTYARTKRKTTSKWPDEQVNGNQYYSSSFDKPNNLIINANYHITKRWKFAANFNYNSGRPVTLPEINYKFNEFWLINYSDRNKYRLPDYHRLDLSITLDESLRLKKKWKGSWTFTILNVYGRKNVYSVFYKKETPSIANNFNSYSLYKLYIIGIPMPTLTYNFTF